MSEAGYSGTPLWKKLGIKEGFSCAFLNAPDDFEKLLIGAPGFHKSTPEQADLTVFFTNSVSDLVAFLSHMNIKMRREGMLWVSWYKKASKKPTEITEDIVRNTALTLDLVDVKVCAIDHEWSGLKLVIRVDRRWFKESPFHRKPICCGTE